MQPPGKYGAPVVSRKSGPVRLLSCQFTHAPNKAPTTTHFFTSAAGREKTPRDVVSRVIGPDASEAPTSA